MSNRISEELMQQFAAFIETYPPREFSIALRNMTMSYIRNKVDLGFPVNFKDFAGGLNELFALLDTAYAEASVTGIEADN